MLTFAFRLSVARTHPKPKIARHAFRVALCYTIVLQAFLAAYTTAFAASQIGGVAADIIICHNTGHDSPSGPDSRPPVSAPCALCAMATSGNALPSDPMKAVIAPAIVADRIQPVDIADTVRPVLARAGLSRAPPHCA
jgi:hypothetical protein